MQVEMKLAPAVGQQFDALKTALAAAIASIPAPPTGVNLLSATPEASNIFGGGPITVTVDVSPEASAWAQSLIAKLNAFAKG